MTTRRAFRVAGLIALAISTTVPGGEAQERPQPTVPYEKTSETTADTVNLDPLVVEARREASQVESAVDAQIAAPNVTSVVAAEEFGPFNDTNPGEILKFLPGIDILPVAPGFNRFGLRGIGPESTELLFDGLPLANMHGERTSRRFDVSVVSAADIAFVEVRKLPLPSDSANSIGGTINLIRRSALDQDRRSITYQFGLRADAHDLATGPLMEPGGRGMTRWRPNWRLVWTEPVNRDFGFSVALGQDDLLLQMRVSDPAWGVGDGTSGSPATLSNPVLTSASLLDSPAQQKKTYVLANMDWRPCPDLLLSAAVGFHDSRQRDSQSVYTWSAGVPREHGPAVTLGGPDQGSFSYNNASWREATSRTTSAQFDAKWKKDAWELSAKAGWSRLAFQFSDTGNGYFNSTFIGPAPVPGLISIPSTGVGSGTANPLPLAIDFRQSYWGLTQIDAATTPSGRHSMNPGDYTEPVAWWSNDVVRIGGVRSRPARAEEILTSFKVYAKRRFPLATPISVQLGLDWNERYRNRRWDYLTWRYVGADGTPDSPDDNAAAIGSGPGTAGFDGLYGYPEPESISLSRLYRLYVEHPAWFRYDAARSAQLTLKSDPAYDIKETAAAPYLQFAASAPAQRLKLTGGVRYERTKAKAHGLLIDSTAAYMRYADGSIVRDGDTNPASTLSDGRLVTNLGTSTAVDYVLVNGPAMLPAVRDGSPVFTPEIQAAGNAAYAANETKSTGTSLGLGTLAYTRAVYHAKGATNTALNEALYPSLHATYDLSDRINLQLGYARTQARIDYSNLIPNNQVLDTSATTGIAGQIVLQNPNLRPWTADNFEARVSWSNRNALVAIGVFDKEVQDFQPRVVTPPLTIADIEAYAKQFPDSGLGPEYEGYTLSYRTNAGSARITGTELEFRAPLGTWLPGPARGFDLSGNITYVHRQGANGDELGLNRPWMGSANLHYTAGRFAIRVGYRFNGEQHLGSIAAPNGVVGEYIRKPQNLFDASIEFGIGRGTRLFISGSNLTNELSVLETRFPGKPDYANLTDARNIGRTCTVGVTGAF